MLFLPCCVDLAVRETAPSSVPYVDCNLSHSNLDAGQQNLHVGKVNGLKPEWSAVPQLDHMTPLNISFTRLPLWLVCATI